MSNSIELAQLDNVADSEEDFENIPPKPCCGHDEYEEIRLRQRVHNIDINRSNSLLVLFHLWVSPLLDLSRYIIYPYEVPHGPKEITLDVIMPKFFRNWTKTLNSSFNRFKSSMKSRGEGNDAVYSQPTSHVDATGMVNELPAPTDQLGIPLSDLPTMFWVITKAFPRETIMSAIFELLLYAFNTCIPYAIAGITDFFEDNDDGLDVNIGHGFGYATALSAICFFVTSSSTVRFYYSINLGVQFRSAIATTVVEKSLRIAPSALGPDYSTGTTLNMISNDSQRFFDSMMWLHCLWSSPLMITVCIILLYFELGIAALATIGLMVLLFPYQLLMAHVIKHFKTQAIKKTDERVKLVSELIQGVRIIKLYAWENAMSERLSRLRAEELALIQRTLILKTMNEIILFIWPLVVTYVTVTIYSVISDDLSQKKVFMLLAFLNAMRYPISLLPTAISSTVEMLVANRRISAYLNKEELSLRKAGPALPPTISPFSDLDDDDGDGGDGTSAGVTVTPTPDVPASTTLSIATTPIEEISTLVPANVATTHRPSSHRHPAPDAPLQFATTARSSSVKPTDLSPVAITVNHCDFYWASFHSDPHQYPVLTDINLKIPHGSLYGIIGPVGIGKTALVTGILGELYINQPKQHQQALSSNGGDTSTQSKTLIDADPNVVFGSYSYTGNNTFIPHDAICIRGRVGYCAQDPWLLNGTLRENITLGLLEDEFDEKKFNRVVEAAALASDIKILAQGADTPVGDSGISLSGGQRARCAFARLLYRADEIDVVFLDDIFAAVDVAVAKTMFFKGVCGILAEKTVVMTLNSHFNFLAHCDGVISLDSVSDDVMRDKFNVHHQLMTTPAPDTAIASPSSLDAAASPTSPSVPPTALTKTSSQHIDHNHADGTHHHKQSAEHTSIDIEDLHKLRGSRKPATINKMGTFYELLESNLHVLSTFDVSRVFSGVPTEHRDALEAFQDMTDEHGGVQTAVDPSKPLTDLTLAVHDTSLLDEYTTTPRLLTGLGVDGEDVYPQSQPLSSTVAPYTPLSGARGSPLIDPLSTSDIAMLQHDHSELEGSAFEQSGLTHSDSMDVVQFELSRRGSIDGAQPPSFANLSLQQQQQYHEQQQLQQQQQQQTGTELSAPIIQGATRPRTQSVAQQTRLQHSKLSSIVRTDDTKKLPLVKTGPAIQSTVDNAYYLKYIRGSKGVFLLYLTIFGILFTAIGAQFFRVVGDYWITLWSKDSPYTLASDHTQYHWRTSSGILVIICFVFLVFRTIILIFVYIDASQYLHDTTFASVMSAPMYWFDTTLIGNILNRFSKDMDQIDTILPDNMDRFIQQFLILIGIVVMACISSYYFIIALLPLLYALFLFRKSFTRTSVQLKRLENSSMSPVYSSFQTILNGAQTIRAYHLQHYFLEIHRKLVDHNAHITAVFNYLQRRLAFLLNGLAAVFVLVIGYLIVILRNSINSQVSILAITMSMQLVGLLQTTVRIHTVLESCMTSVERLDQYSKIPQESQYVTEKSTVDQKILPALMASDVQSAIVESEASDKPETSAAQRLQGWPWRGEIIFNRVCMSYRPDLPLVLNNLSLTVPSGKKVGVIGRTGAGKSSLLLALFRMVELSSGAISIDGVDIADLGLGDLRSRLSIITQQPILFSGTVRSNLDPFGLYSDDAITKALKYAHIYNKVESMPHGIDSSVGEGGGNFSQAERQLLCIARSLLLNNKIIVLDEATASVDPAADEAIQKTIRSAFTDCTILTIAHRLETIADFDYVLVLQPVGQIPGATGNDDTDGADGDRDDDGMVIVHDGSSKAHPELNDSLLEFDTPYNLLTDHNSYFYKMAIEGGDAVYKHLLSKARSARQKSSTSA